MERLMLCGIYMIEQMNYQFGLKFLFDIQKRKNIRMIWGIIFPVIIGILPIREDGKIVLTVASVVGVLFFTMEGKRIEKSTKLVLTLLFLHWVEDVVDYFGNQIKIIEEITLKNRELRYLVAALGTMLFLCVITYFKHSRLERNISIHTGYFLLGIIIVTMIACTSLLDYVKPYVPNERIFVLCNVFRCVSRLSLFFMIILLVYIKNTHETMGWLLESEKMLKEAQEKYYQQMLRKEEDTKRYRHDMNNHLVYLQELLRGGNLEEAKRYLEQMQGIFRTIQRKYDTTGNEIVDMVLNNCFEELPDSVSVNVIGRCPVEFEMAETDVCAVFSNLFQNMAEEILLYRLQNPLVEIKIEKGREYVKYIMKNTAHKSMPVTYKENFPKTHKKDKNNHGIGLGNVEEILTKNGGKFDWCKKEDYFCVELILPLKVTV